MHRIREEVKTCYITSSGTSYDTVQEARKAEVLLALKEVFTDKCETDAEAFLEWVVANMQPKPSKVERRLTEEGELLHEQFRIDFADACCSCHISPPCNFCVAEGNPRNLEEDDTVWEPSFLDLPLTYFSEE